VYVRSDSSFRNGPVSLSDLQNGANIRVVGILLKGPDSGQPVLLAHYVDDLN
jgi:hypothetical protein